MILTAHARIIPHRTLNETFAALAREIDKRPYLESFQVRNAGPAAPRAAPPQAQRAD